MSRIRLIYLPMLCLLIPLTLGKTSQMEGETETPSMQADPSYTHYMSIGLSALDQADFKKSIEAFQYALKAKPGDPQAKEGLSMAQTARLTRQIQQIGDQAKIAEAKEAWREAANLYAEILEKDPHIQFAQTGKNQTLERADLTDSISQYLKEPQRLAARAVLSEAQLVLGMASNLDNPGDRLSKLTAQLSQAIEAYSLPIPIVLQSDGKTNITVYKVGELGAFDTKHLDLRPGSYVVLGSREGYRDVRLQIKLEAGKQPQTPFDIRCKEKI